VASNPNPTSEVRSTKQNIDPQVERRRGGREHERVGGARDAHVEEVEDGGELPHASEPPPRQLRGRLGLRDERRHDAALRRLVRAGAARRGAAARSLRRPGWRRGPGLVVARARQARLPRGRRLLLLRRRHRSRSQLRLHLLRLPHFLLLPLCGGCAAVLLAAGVEHRGVRSGIYVDDRVSVWVGRGTEGRGGGGHWGRQGKEGERRRRRVKVGLHVVGVGWTRRLRVEAST
jgi:hypothetical protein